MRETAHAPRPIRLVFVCEAGEVDCLNWSAVQLAIVFQHNIIIIDLLTKRGRGVHVHGDNGIVRHGHDTVMALAHYKTKLVLVVQPVPSY